MIRQSRKIQFIILLTLVCLVGTMTIAYAILSTTLNITGNTEVIASSWNVHFNNIQVNSASVSPTKTPTITDSKTIDFSVVLNKPGDFYKFNVDIVNDGSINAMIDSVIKSPDLTTDQAKYIKYEIEYINGESISSKQLLSSGETKTISVLLSYRTDITASDLPTTPTTLNLSIQLNYVQADATSSEVVTSPKKIKIVNGDLETVGSEICIGEECFYLISNDGYKVTLFAKYNLSAGVIVNINTNEHYELENPTGIQDSTIRGYIGEQIRVGVFTFASTNYWANDDGLKFEYGGTYPAYVYDSNSYLYSHVENYKTYLEKFDVFIENARLITYEELTKLGCTDFGCLSAPSWIGYTSFWTGTATDSLYVKYSLATGEYGSVSYGSTYAAGVRPVIEVPLTEF